MPNPDTLRTYASILEKPKRVYDEVLKTHVWRQPGEILMAAADALRYRAEAIERGIYG